jgi:hypothetical protein
MTKSMKELFDNGDIATTLSAGDLLLVTRDPSGTPSSKVITRETLQSILDWIADENTWTYSSADDPTFIISVDADMTGLIGVGNRIELVQSGSTKYFIVTAVGTYSGGATLITVFGGTDFDLANETISSPRYSRVKAPFGFPLDRSKWRVTLTDTTARDQSSPTQGAWYNIGSVSMDVPIGQWRLYWTGAVQVQATTSGTALVAGFAGALSTSSSVSSDDELIGRFTFSFPNTVTNGLGRAAIFKEKLVTLTSKTTYYTIINTGAAGVTTLSFPNSIVALVIVAESAYL